MVNLAILAGGYTSAIASYLFNTDTNSLTLTSQTTTGANPSWITLDPNNDGILYATNENTDGALQSFTINSDNSLTLQSTTSSGGDGPAFAAVAGSAGQVAIMNYNSGNGMVIPTASTGLTFDAASLITFPAEVSHPHMALQHGSEILVPDLGADKIWRLTQSSSSSGSWQISGFIQQPTGSGPRHIAIQNGFLYTLHELSSTLTVQSMPAAPNGTSTILSSMSIIPPNPPAGSAFAAAEILFPTADYSFPEQFIFVSNRNTGTQDSRGDAITVFQTTYQGGLSLYGYVYTGLDQIRGMALGGPNLQYLIAGGYAGGGVAMFERTGNGGNLTLLARNTDLPTRSSFVFVEA